MRRDNRYFICTLLVVGVILLLSFDSVAQCAMCRKNAESSLQNGNSIVKGLNTGILYLMAIPYFLIAFIFREQLKTAYKLVRAKISSRKS